MKPGNLLIFSIGKVPTTSCKTAVLKDKEEERD